MYLSQEKPPTTHDSLLDVKQRAAISFLICLLAVGAFMSSCSQFAPGNGRIVKVGGSILYEKDIRQLLPEGVSPEDSAYMVQQYINTWALAHLKLMKAEEMLTKEEKDVTKEVEDYRSNLLAYRFEKSFAESRIDTVVSAEESVRYYEEHPQSFRYPFSIVKGRVIALSKKSPSYDKVRKSFTAKDDEEVNKLREMCLSYAQSYDDFGGEWVSVPSLARLVPGLDAVSCETIFANGDSYIKSNEDTDYFIFITDRCAAGCTAPYEYCKATIKDAVISMRKQEILSKMEQDLLKYALDNNKLKIYRTDE